MLLEHHTLVIQAKNTAVHHLTIPISPRILKHGDLTARHAPLSYRAFIDRACEDSRNHNRSYLQDNSYSHF